MTNLDDAVLDRKRFHNDVSPEPEPATAESAQASPSPYTAALMRRRLLGRRIALEEHWRGLFPRHDFATLRLIRRPLAWDDDAWARAARAYHADRKRGLR